MIIVATLAIVFGLAIALVGIMTYFEPKRPKRKDKGWSCGTMDWMQCTTFPFNEDGQCSYCGKS